jgi:hypothetical protein
MFKIELYIENLISLLKQNFSFRLLYAGLQGSYLRNEADENTGDFLQTKQELLSRLSREDKKVMSKALEIKARDSYNFDEAYQLLFAWCKNTIIKI